MRLRTYIFLCLGAIAISAVLMFAVVESNQFERMLIGEADGAQRFAAVALAQQVEQLLDGHVKAERAVAMGLEFALQRQNVTSVADVSPDFLSNTLRDFGNASELSLTYIGDASGFSVIYGAPPGEANPSGRTDYRDRDYFQQLKKTKHTVMSRVQSGRRKPVPSIQIASPVLTTQGELAGYVAGSFDMAAFDTMTAQLAEHLPGAQVMVLDTLGVVVASAGPRAFAANDTLAAAAWLVPAPRDDVQFSVGAGVDGEVRAALAPIRALGVQWTAAVYRPSSWFDAKLAAVRLRASMAGLVALCCAIGFAAFLSSWVASPIARISQAARAVAAGSSNVEFPQPHRFAPTEVRHIARSVADMTQKLRSYNVALEAKVSELSDRNKEIHESLRALKETKEQLARSDRLAAVGQLAGGVAHDFNNILTVVMMSARFLTESPTASESDRAEAEEILRMSQRAAELTAQLLAFSRQQVLLPRVVSQDAVLRGMQPMLSRLLPETIALSFELQAANAFIKVDPGQLEQVVMNLVVNARDALPSGGTIRLCTECLDQAQARLLGWAAAPNARCVVLSIVDDGSGMEAGVLARIFEPFFTTKGPGKGTGLGLATVYGIVLQSEGEIVVESTLGRGTTFRVFFAAAQASFETQPKPTLPVSAPARRGTILLVEDDAKVRAVTARILVQGGYTVLQAPSPQQAVAMARESRELALLLTDVVMPEMSGLALAAIITESHPRIQTLFMSGYPASENISDAFKDAERFLQKPFGAEQLLAKVDALIATELADQRLVAAT